MNKFCLRFLRDNSGATAIEYGLIAAGIAVAIIVAVNATGTAVKGTFNSVVNALPEVARPRTFLHAHGLSVSNEAALVGGLVHLCCVLVAMPVPLKPRPEQKNPTHRSTKNRPRDNWFEEIDQLSC